MPVPVRIFRFSTTYFRNPSWDIKTDPLRTPFIEQLSMAVDWNPYVIVVCIIRSGSICYLALWELDPFFLYPSRHCHRVLGAAGGISQTSKAKNPPLGVRDVPFRGTVDHPCHVLRIPSNIYSPIWYWSVGHRLRLLDGQ